jgi:hypothetical protein
MSRQPSNASDLFAAVTPYWVLSQDQRAALVRERQQLDGVATTAALRRRQDITQLIEMSDAAMGGASADEEDPLVIERRELMLVIKKREQTGEDWAAAAKAQARVAEIDRLIRDSQRRPAANADVRAAAAQMVSQVINAELAAEESVARKLRLTRDHMLTQIAGGGAADNAPVFMPVKPYWEE